jgi:hypothetical protein
MTRALEPTDEPGVFLNAEGHTFVDQPTWDRWEAARMAATDRRRSADDRRERAGAAGMNKAQARLVLAAAALNLRRPEVQNPAEVARIVLEAGHGRGQA